MSGSDVLITTGQTERDRREHEEERHAHPSERVPQREQLAARQPEHEREHADAGEPDERELHRVVAHGLVLMLGGSWRSSWPRSAHDARPGPEAERTGTLTTDRGPRPGGPHDRRLVHRAQGRDARPVHDQPVGTRASSARARPRRSRAARGACTPVLTMSSTPDGKQLAQRARGSPAGSCRARPRRRAAKRARACAARAGSSR